MNCRDLKKQADEAAAAGDYAKAHDLYQSALKAEPHYAEAYAGMGVIAMAQGDNDAAMQAFKSAVELNDQCAEAVGGLALIYQGRNDHPQAFQMYLKWLELNPDNMMALLGLFQASCQMGTFGQIIHYLESYLKKNPQDMSVLFCLASLYARDNRLAEARAAVLKVLVNEPGKAEAMTLLREIEGAQEVSGHAADSACGRI